MKLTKLLLGTALASSSLAGAAAAEELRMSWWGGDSRHEATQAALIACGEKHGHTINPEFTGWSGHLEKVTTQIAGGTEADIMQINWPWLPLFSANGDGFADLREFSDTIDLSNWTDAQLEAASMAGKLNGLPLSTTGRVFMFNKTMFDKAGVAVPTTWEELKASAPKVKEAMGEKAYPFYATGLDALLIVSLVATQNTGKDLIDPETMQVAWSQNELAAAISFYQELVDSGVIQSWKEAASEGNIALHENANWSKGTIGGAYQWDSTYFKYADPLEEGQELVPVELLTVDGAKTGGVYRKPSMVFSISANSEKQQAAAEIVNCLLNEEEGIDALGTTRGLPASSAASGKLQADGAIEPVLVESNKIVMDSEGPNVSPLNEHPEVRGIFTDTLELFAYGEIDAQTAAEEIILGVNEALEDFQS
ncbi:ABC transporter substrate-binding protein [Algicella marina]|uniref:Extracellular solute-binding protein n=1 Tax=Algicella marina TaxID=2683284 RepID=A0A6P1SYR1_9RHOB|nr:ABC transporter substrate-binding protein [Algicella marina]QHQ34346.1 extracellular solute-binding protein [Algicella marina]